MALLFIPIFLLGLVLFIKSPDLLQKRLQSKEKEPTQKCVVVLLALLFLAGFCVAGLDYRFGWSRVPTWISAIASVLFLVAYCLYVEVMRENAYLSRTIRVEVGQQVIDTGLYGVVRHPMYAATVLLFLMIPFILGSFLSLLPFLGYPVLMAVRIVGEEKLLTEQLQGYTVYKQKVKYRMIPFIW